MTIDQQTLNLLREIADLNGPPTGAFSLRVDGQSEGLGSTQNIVVTKKTDNPGIDLRVAPGTKGETAHVPVVIRKTGVQELVYNDFYIGEGADITIIAGCGIHNDGSHLTQHDGIHVFHVGKNARIKYVEKHYGEGDGRGGRVMNPTTEVRLEEGASMEMDTVQIKGVDSTLRKTIATLGKDSTMIIHEKLMTHGDQVAETEYEIELNGENCSTNVVSRSVARDNSRQTFLSRVNGNAACAGHSECDAIIMDAAQVRAIPEITAAHVDASLIHEAAIGKIAGEQIVKLTTLGLSEEEAEQQIVNGFLR